MQADKILEQRLLDKIRKLVPEEVLLVENYIDSLYQHSSDVSLTLGAAKLSEPALQKIWHNPDDAEYDQL
ncbi:MAG: toxin-antitoxin system, antitoxin component, Xre family protein [Hassallia sp. WJT32-NPBG1]|jgi:N-glycosylase/DNA lyase|nr:toxin-antitoxin system, antitoxin component, Xre family protein [Hassallia sp. WJT32-NPBG1]